MGFGRIFLALVVFAASAHASCQPGAADFALLMRLKTENLKLERGLSIQEAALHRMFVADTSPVFMKKKGQPDPENPSGFSRVFLPGALTGFYLPEGVDLLDPKTAAGYDGYIILMPGIGTDGSEATTLFSIGQTLASGSDSALALGDGKKLRLLPILLDATLGGLAYAAPLSFGKRDATIETVRHARLLLKAAFPWMWCSVGGRSQGALIAMEYGFAYGDIRSVIAMNPSPTMPTMHREAIRLTTQNLNSLLDTPVQFNRSWRSYQDDTPDYLSFGRHAGHERFVQQMPVHPFLPVLFLIGRQDDGYPPEYQPYVRQFVTGHSSRQLEEFEGGHDLWSRRNRSLFKSVVRRMASFLAP